MTQKKGIKTDFVSLTKKYFKEEIKKDLSESAESVLSAFYLTKTYRFHWSNARNKETWNYQHQQTTKKRSDIQKKN